MVHSLAGWLLVLCAVLPFSAARHFGHVHDDHELRGVGSLSRDERASVLLLSTADFFGSLEHPRGQTGFWRPLILWTFRLEHRLAGASEAGYLWLGHTLTILCHAAAVLALWRLLLALGLAEGPALVAAAVFAVHPVHVESVAWASGRVSSLPTALAFGASAIWLRAGPSQGARHLLAGLGFVLALLGKETAVVLVGLAALLGRLTGRSWPAALAVPGAAVLAAVALRAALFGLGRELEPGAYTGPPEDLTRWLTWLAILPDLLRLVLWVGPVSPLHPVAPVTTWSEPMVAAGVCVAGLLGTLTVLAWRRRAALPFLTGGLVVGTLTVLAPWARFPTGFADVAGPLYDRYAYAMAAAPCILGAVAIRGWLARGAWRPLAVVLLVAAPLGWITSGRLGPWSSDEAFARAALAVAPGSADIHNQLGYAVMRAYAETGRPGADAEAMAAFDRALTLAPEHRLASINRFLLLRLLRREEEAEASARALLARWPDDPHVLDNVAGFEAERGRLEQAIELFERALATGRALPGAEQALAECRAALERASR